MKRIVWPLKIYGDKDLSGKICTIPFNTVAISIEGDVRICMCTDWMLSTVGNIYENSLQDILVNARSTTIRQSIVDGNFRYCDETRCGVLLNSDAGLITVTQEDQLLKNLLDPANFTIPSEIWISGDMTCNLSCPSCRKRIIRETEAQQQQNQELLDNLVQNIFPGSSDKEITLYMSATAEVFASSLLLGLLEKLPIDRYPNIRLSLQTNGLLAERRWSRIQHLEKNIHRITVTIDSCTKQNYELLRRGGKFEDMESSLEFFSKKKRELGFQYYIRSVTQKTNCNEIEQFYDYCKQHDADRVEYCKLANWGTFTEQEFLEHDVLDNTHQQYQSTIDTFNRLKEKYNDVFFMGFASMA